MGKVLPITQETVKDVFKTDVSPGDKVIVITSGYGTNIVRGIFMGTRPDTMYNYGQENKKRYICKVPKHEKLRVCKKTGKVYNWYAMHKVVVPGLVEPVRPEYPNNRYGFTTYDPRRDQMYAEYNAKVQAYNAEYSKYRDAREEYLDEHFPYQDIHSERLTSLWLNRIIKDEK